MREYTYMNQQQEQYLNEWHDSFVEYVKYLLSVIETLTLCSDITEKEIKFFEQIKIKLKGNDVIAIERDLAERVIKQDTLNKIERFDKDLIDMCVKHLTAESHVKEFLKQLLYGQIERNKQITIVNLNSLHIPIEK